MEFLIFQQEVKTEIENELIEEFKQSEIVSNVSKIYHNFYLQKTPYILTAKLKIDSIQQLLKGQQI